MRNHVLGRLTRITLLALATTLTGCGVISIEPACPNTMRVGESAQVLSNVVNPGGIASYFWEVFPEDAGTFANPFAADTEFTADIEGEVIIRLTASDGFWQVISQCVTNIGGETGVAVALVAEPQAARVGEQVTLTCTNNGTITATTLTIFQSAGFEETLTEVSEGVVTFTPTEIGDHAFDCIGEAADSTQSQPVTITVTVTENESTDDDTTDTGDRGGGRI